MPVDVAAQFGKKERQDNDYDNDAVKARMDKDPLVPVWFVGRTIRRAVEIADEGGIKTHKVKAIGIEPLLDADDIKAVTEIFEAAYARRTGKTAPPPSLMDELAEGGQAPDGDPTADPGSRDQSTQDGGAEDSDAATSKGRKAAR